MAKLVIGVGGALIKNGKILILKRAKGKTLAQHWEIPGGKIESGEEPDQALKREFLEETGIRVEIIKPYIVWYQSISDRLYIEIDFLVDAKDLNVKINQGEHEGWAWKSKKELEKTKMTPEMRKAVLAAFKT
ncbi:MAG: NUDIX hydrolase [Candidatus Aenigmatarchaeota archaeon]